MLRPSRIVLLAASADAAFAERVSHDLTHAGYTVSIVPEDDRLPQPGEAMQRLAQADACLVVLSPAASASDAVQAYLGTAQVLMQPRDDRRLLVLLAAATPMPSALRHFAHYDFTAAPYEEVWLGVLAALAIEHPFDETFREEDAADAAVRSGPPSGAGDEEQSPSAKVVESEYVAGWGTLPVEPPTYGHSTPSEAPQSAPAPEPSAPPFAPPAPAPYVAPDTVARPMPQSLTPPPPAPYGAPPPYPAPAPMPYAAPPAPGSVGGWGQAQGSGARDGAPAGRPASSGSVAERPRPKSVGGDVPAPPSRLTTEAVSFNAYHPKEVAPQAWEPLLVYTALDSVQGLAAVAADAEQRLAGRREQFRPATAAGESRMTRGTMLTFVPTLPGFRFNPPSLTVAWEEDVQRNEFRMRAETAAPGLAANGSIQIFTGPLLRAEIPLSVFVQQAGGRGDVPGGFARSFARAYRKIFASYSRKDTPIVRSCESAAQAMGDRYLIDVSLLRSGEQWDGRLMQAIADADVFQLFWSPNAAASPAVEREWRYALALLANHPGFVRPVYWSATPHRIPAELGSIHFDRLDLGRLGWSPLRLLLANVFAR